MIFLTGQLNTYEYTKIPGIRQHGFQEMDVVSMAKPVTKYAVQITDEKEIVKELNKAYHLAITGGRMGRVLLDLPMNIQRGQVNEPVYDMEFEETEKDESREAAQAIQEALSRAKRPVILLGNGVREKDASLLLEKFASIWNPRRDKCSGKIPELAFDHPLNFGCIGSAYGHRYANMIVNAKSDLLLCFRISLCPRQTGVNAAGFAQNENPAGGY